MPEHGWIELFNQSEQIANLSNWQLSNPESKTSFVFPENTLIGPNQFLVLSQDATKLSFYDQIQLLYPDQSLAAQISYDSKNGDKTSVAFDGQNYFQTKIPTPGIANIISASSLTNEDQRVLNNYPVINQYSQEPLNDQTKINLAQNQDFASVNIEESDNKTTLAGNGQSNPPIAALNQPAQKNNLILVLSIIVSASLLASWFLIQIRKKISH